jgi:D-glycero-D-manno-heptose 1,7-bisphosphate phosphatase
MDLAKEDPRSMSEPLYLESDGIWCRMHRPADTSSVTGRPALFLDRDGVVVEEVHFLQRPEDVRLVPGAAAVMAEARRQGIAVVLTTNQSGIARGLFGWEAFAAVQSRLEALLAAEQAAFDMVLACPFHPDGDPPYRAEHPCRKPRPGMLLRAAERLGLDLAASWAVGDRARDLEAGRRAGCAGGLHVLTGYGAAEREAAIGLAARDFDVRLGASVAEARSLPLFRR